MSWHLSYSWGKPPEKTSTRKLTRPGIESVSAAWEVLILPLGHKGGHFNFEHHLNYRDAHKFLRVIYRRLNTSDNIAPGIFGCIPGGSAFLLLCNRCLFYGLWVWWIMVKWIVVMKIQPSICLDDWGKSSQLDHWIRDLSLQCVTTAPPLSVSRISNVLYTWCKWNKCYSFNSRRGQLRGPKNIQSKREISAILLTVVGDGWEAQKIYRV